MTYRQLTPAEHRWHRAVRIGGCVVAAIVVRWMIDDSVNWFLLWIATSLGWAWGVRAWFCRRAEQHGRPTVSDQEWHVAFSKADGWVSNFLQGALWGMIYSLYVHPQTNIDKTGALLHAIEVSAKLGFGYMALNYGLYWLFDEIIPAIKRVWAAHLPRSD